MGGWVKDEHMWELKVNEQKKAKHIPFPREEDLIKSGLNKWETHNYSS